MTSQSSSSSTIPCSFYGLGKCKMGSACKFYHAAREDLAKSPLVCKFYLQNACKLGRRCKYSHDSTQQPNNTRGNPKLSRSASLSAGTFRVRCRFFDLGSIGGGCALGTQCPYVHETLSQSEISKLKRKDTAPKKEIAQKEEKQVDQIINEECEYTTKQYETAVNDFIPTRQAREGPSHERSYSELSDFISKEEELYYYGAPGELERSLDANGGDPCHITYDELEMKPSYRAIAGQHVSEDDTTSPNQEHNTITAICSFYIQGVCKYGNKCIFSHSLQVPDESDIGRQLVEEEVKASAEIECNICYEQVLAKHERFGLLSGCDHAFCLSCIRNWRGHSDQSKQNIRKCPVCRVETAYIIPSSRLVTDPERKQALQETFKQNLASIPCRHFDQGRGECPFGTSCFYKHQYSDGSLDARQVRTAVDADGHYDVLRQVRLDHFLGSQLP
uniref:Uncharacterized protein AlNc14C3G393 n=1 Tax=Albugo laibachii Nc14 TaxID=890382 RepID=F0VZR4_9STRA|nr:conserved hypothetical protein [Albugo laibachii Nc14]|eukprot:CCA14285.1 conserved hypothetical protein [Albugo laibachii Nc14]